MGKLNDKVAVVTGGTSGMALASAKLFVEEGARVFISGRHQDGIDRAVRDIGRNVIGIKADSSNLDDLDNLYDVVNREAGSIDVLYASAGIGEPLPIGDITLEHYERQFNLNTRGTLFTVNKAIPLFNDGGSILMTGSIASVKGWPGWSVYAASKAALHAFARGWVSDLAPRNIRVNVLSPGQVFTATQEEVMRDPEMKAAFEAMIPRRRMGTPEEIASVALFLASDDSSYVNGMELKVDGGTSSI